jgi:hypothetical protein
MYLASSVFHLAVKMGIRGPSSPDPVCFPSLDCFLGSYRFAAHRYSTSMMLDKRESNQALYLFLLAPCAPPLETIKGRGGQRLQGLDLR